MHCCFDVALLRLFAVKLWNIGKNLKLRAGKMV